MKCSQVVDTSVYQVCDLEDVEFYWERDQLDLDAVFRPGIDTDTPFYPSTFNCFEGGSLDENSILIDKEQDKENSPHLPATPVPERQTQPLC